MALPLIPALWAFARAALPRVLSVVWRQVPKLAMWVGISVGPQLVQMMAPYLLRGTVAVSCGVLAWKFINDWMVYILEPFFLYVLGYLPEPNHPVFKHIIQFCRALEPMFPFSDLFTAIKLVLAVKLAILKWHLVYWVLKHSALFGKTAASQSS